MLLAAVLLWSLNFTVGKYVLGRGFQPLAFAATRMALAAVLSLSFAFGRERSLRMTRRDLALVVLGAIMLMVNQLGWVYALRFTNASTVAVILGSTPILIGV